VEVLRETLRISSPERYVVGRKALLEVEAGGVKILRVGRGLSLR